MCQFTFLLIPGGRLGGNRGAECLPLVSGAGGDPWRPLIPRRLQGKRPFSISGNNRIVITNYCCLYIRSRNYSILYLFIIFSVIVRVCYICQLTISTTKWFFFQTNEAYIESIRLNWYVLWISSLGNSNFPSLFFQYSCNVKDIYFWALSVQI